MSKWLVAYSPHARDPFQPIVAELDSWLEGKLVPVAFARDDETAALICKLYNDSLVLVVQQQLESDTLLRGNLPAASHLPLEVGDE